MQWMRTPKPHAGLLALPLALLLMSCGGDSNRPLSAGSKPAQERVRPVDGPVIPMATTPCAFDPQQLCNSDEETGGVIQGLASSLAEANRKLCWLGVWFGYPACVEE